MNEARKHGDIEVARKREKGGKVVVGGRDMGEMRCPLKLLVGFSLWAQPGGWRHTTELQFSQMGLPGRGKEGKLKTRRTNAVGWLAGGKEKKKTQGKGREAMWVFTGKEESGAGKHEMPPASSCGSPASIPFGTVCAAEFPP